MRQTKVDNSYLADKVELRARHLPEGDIVVLDCYSGEGLVWAGVSAVSGRKIRRLPIDIKRIDGFGLTGNNMSFLTSINLGRFNVVDLDAYGIPYEQLKTLFDRKYSGHVFVTCIQVGYGGIPHGILIDLGFTSAMIKRIPSLFYRYGWEFVREWLARNGVKNIYVREKVTSQSKKRYFYFNGAEAASSHLDSPKVSIAVGLS